MPDPTNSTGIELREDGYALCPDCNTWVNCGRGGIKNLNTQHRGALTCKANKKKRVAEELVEKTKLKSKAFFVPRPPKVPSTVTPPPPIRSQQTLRSVLKPVLQPAPIHLNHNPDISSAHRKACPVAIACLDSLLFRIQNLPSTIEEAATDHPLASFSRDPTGSVGEGEDAWEKWDGVLNSLLQRSPEELQKLVVRGDYGLLGLHRFLDHLVKNHGIVGALIEGKIERLNNAIDSKTPSPMTTCKVLPVQQENTVNIIDVDALPNPTVTSSSIPSSESLASPQKLDYRCTGIIIKLAAGQSAHTAYPFALHEKLGDPWDYSAKAGQLILRARKCGEPHVLKQEQRCPSCALLAKNENLIGIVDRMGLGVHANSPFYYHGMAGLVQIAQAKTGQVRALRLRKLNEAKKLVAKSGALNEHKQWIMAVGSGKVERVERLVRAGLAQKRGIRAILKMHNEASGTIWKTRIYSEDDYLRGVLLWRLGGARVADIGHEACGLPATRTLRNYSLMPPLITSPGQPKVIEVVKNVESALTLISKIIEDDPTVVHQILGFDELKSEARPRWDEKTNQILGICREHGQHCSLSYTSKLEVDLLFEQILSGNVHLATNATIGAIGILSDNHRLYNALPILISGQCGRESGAEHAQVIQTVLEGAKSTRLRTISVASDGESRRGEALALLTLKRPLDPQSPIYPLLSGLPLMNFLVGDDDLTADKDYKHVFKRLRNLILRERGIKVHGIHLHASTLQSHLADNKVATMHINYIMKPDDKQDVKLAYDLLYEVWRLPSQPTSTAPGVCDARGAFSTLGIFFRHVILPYICIDLTLSEQLIHISAAAHQLLAMIHEDKAGSLLMPTQLILDLMLMFKNFYFCVAKTQVDNPRGKFHAISMGTDRLEELFGILRTMVGNDSSVDIYQLGLRLVGTAEVSGILAKHPEWDRSPRRLRLPALAKDGLDIHQNVDHIKPASWRGNVEVAQVNLKTCWMLGRQELQAIPRLHRVLKDLETRKDPAINILQPFGADIIHAPRSEDDYDDTAESYVSCPPETAEVLPLGTDVEDAIVEEEPTEKYSPTFEHDGMVIWKSRYLKERFKELQVQSLGSRDRLKRYADIPRYSIRHDPHTNIISDLEENDSPYASSFVSLQFPLATLLKCDGKLFLSIGEAAEITFASKHQNSLPVEKLSDPLTFISVQLLYFVPAAAEDDPSLKNDWAWNQQRGTTFRVPGRLVQAINPDISTRTEGKPIYLLDSKTMRALGSSLFEALDPQDNRHIPEVQISPKFPYREENGKACFRCEDEDKERDLLAQKQCPLCQTDLPKSPQRVLEHVASHIMYDQAVDPTAEPCGLCLRSSQCRFYLTKRKGSASPPKLDLAISQCVNLIGFSYTVASTSTSSSPCSNVPISCTWCPPFSPAVWRYNIKHHIETTHPHVSLPENEHLWKIGRSEKAALNTIWGERSKVKGTRKSKKGKGSTLVISDAHSSRLALIDGDDEAEVEEDEDEAAYESERDTDRLLEENLEMYNADCAPVDANIIVSGGDEQQEGQDAEPETNSGGQTINSSQSDATTSSTTPTSTESPQEPPGASETEFQLTPSDDTGAGPVSAHVVNENRDMADDTTSVSQRGRIRKRRAIVLDGCLCGATLSSSEWETDGIRCKNWKGGCETQWFHLQCVKLEFRIANWMCDSCQGSQTRGKRRRPE